MWFKNFISIFFKLTEAVLIWCCRPAYMDEYEKLEMELQLCYDDYMLKFRNQAYLENILDEYHRAQLDENEVAVDAFFSDYLQF